MRDEHLSRNERWEKIAVWRLGVSQQKYEDLRDIMNGSLSPDLQLPSAYHLNKYMDETYPVPTKKIDCCVNSHMAFAGQWADLDHCVHCSEPRYSQFGKPRRQFTYLELAPRLSAQYAQVDRCHILSTYRASFKTPRPDNLKDIFDGRLYHDFHRKEKGLFSQDTDVALQISLDGFQLVARKNHSTTPVILINLNLPPNIRYKKENILASFVIPGPKKQANLDSFLVPLIDELKQLGEGLRCTDAANREFTLRAWPILVTGDGPAIAEVTGFKYPGNAKFPCRFCDIEAKKYQRNGNKGNKITTYYPVQDRRGRVPLKNDDDRTMRQRIDQLAIIDSKDEWDKRGMTRKSILTELGSLHFTRSFPVDIMHCVLLNVVPMLYSIFSGGKFGDDWSKHWMKQGALERISESMEKARPSIPGHLGHAPRSIKNHSTGYKAEEWRMWLSHYGPALLEGELHDRFRKNFVDLTAIYQLSTGYEINTESMVKLSHLCQTFVRDFEQLHYGGLEERMPVCTINIHSLLHLGDNVRDLGPACYYWQFPMERFCGQIKPKAGSRSQLDASLMNSLISIERVNQISWRNQPLGPSAGRHFPIPETFERESSLSISTSLRDLVGTEGQEVQFCRRLRLSEGLLIGSERSQRMNTLINRQDHQIVFRSGQKWQFGLVRCFACVGSPIVKIEALVRICDNVQLQRRKRFATFSSVGKQGWVDVQCIAGLFGVIVHEGKNHIVTDVDIFSSSG